MGFEARQFPALQPLDVAWQRQQAAAAREQQADEQPEQQPAGAEESSGELQGELEEQAAATSSSSSSAGSDSAGGGSGSRGAGSRGGRGCTTATFARWAQAAGGELPLLASQWRRGAGGWDLGPQGRRWLQEAHAAHEWGGAAEEHARAMLGERGWPCCMVPHHGGGDLLTMQLARPCQ